MNSEDKIIQKLVEIDEKLGLLASKEELYQFKDEVMGALDEQLTVLKRLDQERLFTLEIVKRLEADLERVKTHLHLT